MRVLVATDLSGASDVAVREAATYASSPADVLGAIHVLAPFHAIATSVLGVQAADLSARAARAVRAQVAKSTGRAVEVLVEEGSAHELVLERAKTWSADLLVVGTHGHLGLARILGGVAERVVRGASCRVLVARPNEKRGWVLAATDLSEPSLRAVTAAAEEAKRRSAQLKVVQSVGFLALEMSYLLDLSRSESPRNSAALVLSDAIAALGIDAECAILDRSPAAAVVEEAETIDAELVVVGAHRAAETPAILELALGGVTERVVRSAPCSVLVVH